MEVKVANSAGFCFGVSRAVDAVYCYIEEHPERRIFTYGPIVHNEQVVEDLSKKGVSVIRDGEELAERIADGSLRNAALIIRAHGIGDHEKARLNALKGTDIVDATCPYVSKIHDIVRNAYKRGDCIVITGDPEHPEVKGIMGCAGGNAYVLRNEEEARLFELPGPAAESSPEDVCGSRKNAGKGSPENSCGSAERPRITLVSQTTFNVRKFEDIVEIFKKKMYDVTIVNTICNATQRRQSEAADLSRHCDVMLVIGGSSSSNTAKLYEICRSECQATYYIRCLDDLSRVAIGNSVRCIGITAGASTPKTIIEEVLNYVRTEFW